MTSYVRLMRTPGFGPIWIGATVSIVGDAVSWVSLVWLTYELGGGVADLAILAAWYTGPIIVGGLTAGVLLDRFDRRRLLILDNAVRGLVMLSVPVAATLGVLTQLQLDIVAAVYSFLWMVTVAGIRSLVPDLVAADDLVTANAMESVSFGLGGAVGPALGGVLIGIVGAAANLALDAATYFAFVACLLVARLPGQGPATEQDAATAPSPRRAVGLGPAIRFIVTSPAIAAITLMFMGVNMAEGMLAVLLPVYARDVLGVDAAGYGLLASAFTTGLFVGALAVGGVRWRWPLGRSIAAGVLGTGLALAPLALGPALVVAALAIFFAGLAESPVTLWANTIRMRLIPAELRGRAFGVLGTLVKSTPPLGGLAAGGLLAIAGVVPTVAVMAVVAAVPGAVGLFHASLSAGNTVAPATPRPAAAPPGATARSRLADGPPGREPARNARAIARRDR
jgi:MFS family permease